MSGANTVYLHSTAIDGKEKKRCLKTQAAEDAYRFDGRLPVDSEGSTVLTRQPGVRAGDAPVSLRLRLASYTSCGHTVASLWTTWQSRQKMHSCILIKGSVRTYG